MNTRQRDSYQLKKVYRDALPNSNIAADRLQVAMGFESGEVDDHGQLVVAPWHMPLPRELQGLPQMRPPQSLDAAASIATDTTIAGIDITKIPNRQAQIGPRPKRGRKRGRPSNQLERSLHNKNLAQHLFAAETEILAPFPSTEANPEPVVKDIRPSFNADEFMNKILKRKLSMVSIPPAPVDDSITGDVSNLVSQPAFQHYRRMTGRMPIKSDLKLKKGKSEYPKAVEYAVPPDTPSPPRRRSMPPIEAVLAHGFKTINSKRPVESITPRSHAHHPWTNLTLSHRILSPTPAFLLNISPFVIDENNDTQYWKPSLPQILSHHLANPATLIEETPIRSLTFHLPPPDQTAAATSHGKQPRVPKHAHYKTEGPESSTEVRMIRMILPPALNADTGSEEEVPHTDWLLFCLSDSGTPATTRILRSASLAPKHPYTLIAIPTYAIAQTAFVPKSPVPSAEGEKTQETFSTILKFIIRGRLPLMFGVGRDVNSADKWIRGFGTGVASLEVEVKRGNLPCWL